MPTDTNTNTNTESKTQETDANGGDLANAQKQEAEDSTLQGYFKVTISSGGESKVSDVNATNKTEETQDEEDPIDLFDGDGDYSIDKQTKIVLKPKEIKLEPFQYESIDGVKADLFEVQDNVLDIPISEPLLNFDLETQKESEGEKVTPQPENVYVFDQRKGEIVGRPYVTLSTRYHNYAEFIINDPDGTIYSKIKDFTKVEIEIGFDQGFKATKFTGSVWWIGRKLPIGTIIKAMDDGAKLQSVNTPTVTNNASTLAIEDIEKLDLSKVETGIFSGDKDMGDYIDDQTYESFPLSGALFSNLSLLSQNNNSDYFLVADSTFESLIPNSADTVINTLSATPDDKKNRIKSLLKGIGAINGLGKTQSSVAQNLFQSILNNEVQDLSNFTIDKQGEVTFQATAMEASVNEASLQGEILITDANGNTVKNTPGDGLDSGVTFDYNQMRSAFLYQPRIIKKSAVNNRGGYMSVSMSGWDIRNKTVRGATAAVAGEAAPPASGTITVPEWGQLNINDPIYDGCVYTWADATYNGTRVPTKEIMQSIVGIAQVVQYYTNQTVGAGKKWKIISWYRDPVSNKAAGGRPKSYHLTGRAVDFYFEGCFKWHDQMAKSYNGGLAKSTGSAGLFVHIDNRGTPDRWIYS